MLLQLRLEEAKHATPPTLAEPRDLGLRADDEGNCVGVDHGAAAISLEQLPVDLVDEAQLEVPRALNVVVDLDHEAVAGCDLAHAGKVLLGGRNLLAVNAELGGR